MTRIALVPFAVILTYKGRELAALGLPVAWMFPGLMQWLESGVRDL